MTDTTTATAELKAHSGATLATFDRILVPIDFSAAARAAFATAMRFAERWGSDVVVFHAAGIDGNDEFLGHTGVPWGRSDVIGAAVAHLRRFADAVVAGSSARVIVDATREDRVVPAVVRACERNRCTVVVLGARPSVRRLRRSTAERIVRAIDRPVLVVHGERETRADADQ